MANLIDLCKQFIAMPSLTPEDAGCQHLIAEHLKELGFHIEHMPYGNVNNLWARRGKNSPLFVFAGHTDVVPPGELTQWHTPPFQPVEQGGYLFGRGAADMKCSIAAMLVACERFIAQHPSHHGSIGFLITSDEEGIAVDGTVKVVDCLWKRQEIMQWCLIGEPSSSKRACDVIKVGRRGSLNGILKIHGVQGHVAYPHLADNPIHRAAPALAALCAERWDQGNEFFPPTSFQISNIRAGTGANNVIPASLEAVFNFRFSTESSVEQLKQGVTQILQQFDLKFTIEWQFSGPPFITRGGRLIDAARLAISELTGMQAELSTSGGTSDGRFIAPRGVEVIELGPANSTIHKVNECVNIDDLHLLTAVYERILRQLLT